MAKKFKYFLRGKVVVLDKEHEQQIVAIIEFTPLDELTPEEFDDLGTVSKFLHRCKDFVNPVSSDTRSWGGKDVGGGVEEVYGRLQAIWNPSAILGKSFKDMANIAFDNNHELMAALLVPAFCSLHYQDQLGKFDCSPNSTPLMEA
ncbi:hypothetical protein PCANC_19800 [Puccinia coronata f. sp. avenae]|uniref:Uncharacterized protein n=1 Tax=Puccinia coronata f. sp. avenae TaxID=200324 RepID=A0A2N5UPT2_9BASI|nr:hypothetical protein PCANC_19800 [Puccinia coronata f. sp. avenae]